MFGHCRHVHFVRSPVEIDDVSGDSGHDERRSVSRCALIETIDEDVGVPQRGKRSGTDLRFDFWRNL
jgi:hypothetical protein